MLADAGLRARRHRAGDPRHDARHQRDHRAQGRATALLTTEGFRDVLEIANESRYDQYDLNIELPQPLVPRRWRLPVPERLDNDGQRAAAARRGGGARAGRRSCRREGIESLADRLPARLRQPGARAARGARSCADAGRTCRSRCRCEVSPEMREYERFSTTVANAYVQPLMARYLQRLEAGLRGGGPRLPAVPDAVGRRADHARDRGALPDPPGGKRPGGRRDLLGASSRGSAGSTEVLSFDMGGTTAKICLIDDFAAAGRAHLRGRARRPLQEGLAACRCASR